MEYSSTKQSSPEVNFQTALFQGLAPDGGLYMPVVIPTFSSTELKSLSTLQEVGFAVLRKWIDPEEIPDSDLRVLVEKSLTFPTPLITVGDYSILELFHGPTMAFKDIAAGVIAHLFEYFLKKNNGKISILVATSGDTGGAMAQAFSGLSRIKLVVLYPEGKVSKLQEEQLTRVGSNIFPLEVPGDFDDCQKYTKLAFQDSDLDSFNLSSANSINIGRLAAQIIYYIWSYKQLGNQKLQFIIPSGNLGNATACLFAKRMGLPVASMVIATNENDMAVTYFKTGNYAIKKTVPTLSTAMDIGNPSNFERILALCDYNHKTFCKDITAVKVSDKQTIKTVKHVYKKYGYLLDFHTAVAYHTAEKNALPGIQSVVVSTASPLKFAEEIFMMTGIKVSNESIIAELKKTKKRSVSTKNNYESVKKILLSTLS